MHVGLTYDQAHDIPFGELLDLIHIDMIKTGIAELKKDETEEFFALLEWR